MEPAGLEGLIDTRRLPCSRPMIVRTLDELVGSDRDIVGDGWRSRRVLRRDDGMSHSLHWTEIKAGTELELRYRHHLEST